MTPAPHDETCTGCYGSGYDGMREQRCHCQPPLAMNASSGVTDLARFGTLRDVIAETAADLSNGNPYWTAGCLASALMPALDAAGWQIVPKPAEGRPPLTSAMVRLIIAARIVAFEDQGAEALAELDRASEAFAADVPWDDEPTAEEEAE